ncbi:Eco57I restriction-modification methylase domain-containing protein [Umezakia ovalisporum]|uniref:Eco57I restriction-modification methylase domain-containing protein n=1 Tax=Umezakia ovalisporum TaxID=75695 RepID=UPI0024745325|nr:DNA methyltransferase [Umezakia ovalisporum]MDH6089324.1 N-6 DNA methylase [Umezakia ovalisporum Ak1311]
MIKDSEIKSHKEWLGFLQPVGLVVYPIALSESQVVINRNPVELQQKLAAIVYRNSSNQQDNSCYIKDFRTFALNILDWQPQDLVESPTELTVSLPDYHEILTPTYAVPKENGQWMMLVQELEPGINFDKIKNQDTKTNYSHSTLSPQAKFERLLKETKIYTGLLCNGKELRLVYAPPGESSGHLTFPVTAMTEVSGRIILGAMVMLLSADRLFIVPSHRRLPAILEKSRKYQNQVSTQLSEQVLEALWELLLGFQTAYAITNNLLLTEIATTAPQHIYGGLITVLMRLVFLLYAEDRDLMSQDKVYANYYSVTGLYQRLRSDAGNYPDTIDQRYGAWSSLLSLFRLVYNGASHGELFLPPRHGQLFDPEEYPFLENRPLNSKYQPNQTIEPPRLADGVIYRVLQKLLILDGERLSYRSLDVEHIGSVYEAIMGYQVQIAKNPSIGLWSKPQGAKTSVTVVVELQDIIQAKPPERAKLLKNIAGCEVTGKILTDLKAAHTEQEILAALAPKISPKTPNLIPRGCLYLQPGQERRTTGSHYTPRALTEPIVKETLKPVLAALGKNPTPQQILDLKICDIAMGSGAFLVESCRQLAEKLVTAWNQHNTLVHIPHNEEPLLYAQRIVAQQCLYGVDKNPFAVNLAKLSLWLVTLAKTKAFTFLDHALKWGDSLVGLTSEQIKNFNWNIDTTYNDSNLPLFHQTLNQTEKSRWEIYSLGIDNYQIKQDIYRKIEVNLENIRLQGNLVVAAFFAHDKDKKRKDELNNYRLKIHHWRSYPEKKLEIKQILEHLGFSHKPIPVFNWEIEFPEIFNRNNPGFDVIVGNPPFAGKNTLINAHIPGYLDWLKVINPQCHGNADLVAHFFRRAFSLLRQSGCFGLIATNTIAQGDTRSTGLTYICHHGGIIYNAQRRLKWPGLAAVVVSVVHVIKQNTQRANPGVVPSQNSLCLQPILDGEEVPFISAFLFKSGKHDNPPPLLANADKSFQGSIVLGMGFTFDDDNLDATPIADMHRLIEKDSKNQERIFPYIGGEEVNSSPTHEHRRYVINFGDMTEEEAREYPDLMHIVEEKVKPERDKQKRDALRIKWWQYAEKRPGLVKAIAPLERVLVTNAQASMHLCFIFHAPNVVFANSLNIFPFQSYSTFAVLQSRIHETWARFFSSTLEDRLRYNPSDCFETFPFPENWEINSTLEAAGKQYYEYRAAMMVRHNQGLTTTYNRFHDPDEWSPEILQLRQLHQEMDKAVLNAYGWCDISIDCDFLLDYEEEEEVEHNTKPQKKKPWRYRWGEGIRDEILARLLQLNQQQSEAEILGGKFPPPK